MKKYSTNYFEWTVIFLIDLVIVGILIYATNMGLTYHKKYTMDLTGYTLTAVAVIVFGLIFWETLVIIDFLVKDVKGQVTINKEKLTILKGGKQETFDFKDLIKIELFGL